MFNEDSKSVTKEQVKRFDRMFGTEGRNTMNSSQINDAYVQMRSPKNFTDAEIKEMLKSSAKAKKGFKTSSKAEDKPKKFAKGGKVRGCGIAKKGVRAAKMR